MYTKKLLTSTAIASLATLFAVQPASATDLFTPDDAYQKPAPSWTGFWVGLNGGGVFANTEAHYSDDDYDDGDFDPRDSASVNVDGLGSEGLFGEAQIGFDKQVSRRFVFGVFGGLNLSDAEFSASGQVGGDTLFTVSGDYEWGGVAGVRLGLIKSQHTMFYVGGGYAYAELGGTTGTIGDDAFTLEGQELDGWFGEVGMETRLAPYDNLFLTVAGRYTDYGTETLWSDGSVESGSVQTIETDTDSLAVMIGLKAKLGGL